jgi:predicted nucleic acid-binding protein
MILDTTFLIDVLRGDPVALDRLDAMEAAHEPQRIAAPTVFELWRGIAMSDKPDEEKREVEEVLRSSVTSPLDFEAAVRGGEIDERLEAEGKRADPEGSMVAGIALTVGDAVLTRNIEHFGRIRGVVPSLVIEEY